MTIKAEDYMVRVQGGREYLPVAPRIVMFRAQHPEWSILTSIKTVGDEMVVRAEICNSEGYTMATAHKTVTAFRGGAIEKAETGAIGRALSLCGFGTIAAGDMDEGDEIADSPVQRRNGQNGPTIAAAPEKPADQPTDAADARSWLEAAIENGKTRMGAVANAAAMTGQYNAVPHALNAMKSYPVVVENEIDVKQTQTLSGDGALALFDWLMARKEADDEAS